MNLGELQLRLIRTLVDCDLKEERYGEVMDMIDRYVDARVADVMSGNMPVFFRLPGMDSFTPG